MRDRFVDMDRVCVECDAGYTWTAEEQEYHAAHPDWKPPRRCRQCRAARRALPSGQTPHFDANARTPPTRTW